MATKDKALKMAIEALQNNQTYDWKGNPLTALDEANEKIINACKEALEQPAWQGLTDDEIIKHWDSEGRFGESWVQAVCLARAIENTLKEKNV